MTARKFNIIIFFYAQDDPRTRKNQIRIPSTNDKTRNLDERRKADSALKSATFAPKIDNQPGQCISK